MQYEITRTSMYGDQQPCEEAYKVTIDDWDVRTFKTEEEYDKKLGATDRNWRDEGTDHGTWEGGIRRKKGQKEIWCVDVDDLPAFVRKYGQIVISPKYFSWDTSRPELAIEIYDGYRE